MARKTYDLKLALEYTSAICRLVGYLSKMDSGTPGNGADPTSVVLRRWLDAAPGKLAGKMLDEDTVRADEALAWLAKLSPTNDFYQSLVNLNTGGYYGRGHQVDDGQITKSDFGFVACVYSTMERESERKISRAKAEEDGFLSKEYIGEIKKRDDFFVKLLKVNYNSTTGCHIYNVKDRKGNLGIFFSNSDPRDMGLTVEDCFLARMTPKYHNVSKYHGGKETVFNRVKVLQNVGGIAAQA